MFPTIHLPQKPQYISITDSVEFHHLFAVLEPRFHSCFILESLAGDTYDSRYAVIGFDPDIVFTAWHNTLQICINPEAKNHIANFAKIHDVHPDLDYCVEVKNPYRTLQNLFPQPIISRNYAGGLVGYCSYEAANYVLPVQVQTHPDFPQFQFGLYTDGLVFDRFTGEITYFFYGRDRSDVVHECVHVAQSKNSDKQKPPRLASQSTPPGKGSEEGQTIVKFLGDSQTQAEHKQAVLSIIEEIKAGNTFQCEAGFKSLYEVKGDTFPIYQQLRQVNPSPHMFYLKHGLQIVMGASPELLYRQRDGQIETFPLAGTAGRGATLSQDQQLTRDLLNDKKEVAEHLMLVDMHRNDLGRISQFGTVKVRKLMDIVKYSHVQHISSEITGILAPKLDAFDGLASLLPGGVLNGAPKVESMKIIDTNEPEARGPYGGALGQFGLNGNATFAIPIRSLFINGTQAYAQTSSGIVLDSNPENEYQEIQRKLGGMKKTLSTFEG